MPIDIEGRQDGVGVIYNCRGPVTIDDFFQAGLAFLACPEEIKKWRYCIIDLTAVQSMNTSSRDIRSVVEQNKRIAAVAVPGVILSVASPRDLGFGLSRMWEALMDEVGWETITLRSRAEAESWVHERVRQKFGMEMFNGASCH
jgi:hypothetical protein